MNLDVADALVEKLRWIKIEEMDMMVNMVSRLDRGVEMRCLGLFETSLRLVGSCDPPVSRRIFRFI